jgi:hypothetical protein
MSSETTLQEKNEETGKLIYHYFITNFKRKRKTRCGQKTNVLTVPIVISLISRSESPSFLYCKALVFFFSASVAVMGGLSLVLPFGAWRVLL